MEKWVEKSCELARVDKPLCQEGTLPRRRCHEGKFLLSAMFVNFCGVSPWILEWVGRTCRVVTGKAEKRVDVFVSQAGEPIGIPFPGCHCASTELPVLYVSSLSITSSREKGSELDLERENVCAFSLASCWSSESAIDDGDDKSKSEYSSCPFSLFTLPGDIRRSSATPRCSDAS